MTTTISATAGGDLILPKEFCRRKKIKPGSSVRVTEVGDGYYVTPVPEPTEKELEAVLAAAGSLSHPQTPEEEAMVNGLVREFREEKKRRKG